MDRVFRIERTLRGFAAAVAATLLATGAFAQLANPIDLDDGRGSEDEPILHVDGEAENDQFGGSQAGAAAFGDFDGDGFDDLLAGAPFSDDSGTTDRGKVYVVFGGPGVKPLVVDLTSPPSSTTEILGAAEDDGAGFSVAAGDVNGDGFDDAIVGAPFADADGARTDAGEVYVVYGSSSFRSQSIDLSDTVGDNGETRIYGDDNADECGSAVAAGDLNGDGFADIIVGARFGDPLGRTDGGEGYVIFGASGKPGATAGGGTEVDLSANGGGDDPSDSNELRIRGFESGDFFGAAAAAGDIDGDGFIDAIFGAPEDTGSEPGSCFVVYGASSGLPDSTIDVLDIFSSSTRIIGRRALSHAGSSVGSGDINGDGFDDVLFGAPESNPASRTDAGEAWVIYGRTQRPGTELVSGGQTEVDLETRIGQPGFYGETEIYGASSGDNAGNSIAGGDVDGDGIDDIVIGAPFATPSGRTAAGIGHVVFGSTAKPGTALTPFSGTRVDLAMSGANVEVLGDDAADFLGVGSVAGGDLDRDGLGEFGFAGPTIDGGSASNVGGVATVFGDASGTTGTAILRMRAGNAPLRGVGGRLSPDMRTQLTFIGGDGGGSGVPSVTTVTIVRSDAAIANLGNDNGDVADVHWRVQASRSGISAVGLAFQYTEAEIAGLIEGNLKLYTATSPTGTWTEVSGATIDMNRNVAEAAFASINAVNDDYFALASFVPEGEVICVLPNPTMDPGDEFGRAVTLIDNTHPVVGAPKTDHGGNDDVGAVYVFDPSDCGTPLISIYHPADEEGAEFGRTVAYFNNAGTHELFVGAWRDDIGSNADAGAVYRYQVDLGMATAGLTSSNNTFNNPNANAGDHFGEGLVAALVNPVLFVGAYLDEDPSNNPTLAPPSGTLNTGMLYIYIPQITSLAPYITIPNPTPGLNDTFGTRVATFGDRILVSSPRHAAGVGEVAVFSFNEAFDMFMHDYTLTNPSNQIQDFYGLGVVALSAEFGDKDPGSAVGAWGVDADGTNTGRAYIYDGDGNLVRTVSKPGTANTDAYFGHNLSSTFTRLFIAAPGDTVSAQAGAGVVYEYNHAADTLRLTIPNPEPGDFDRFGSSTAAAADFVLIGALGDDYDYDGPGGNDPIASVGTAFLIQASDAGAPPSAPEAGPTPGVSKPRPATKPLGDRRK